MSKIVNQGIDFCRIARIVNVICPVYHWHIVIMINSNKRDFPHIQFAEYGIELNDSSVNA